MLAGYLATLRTFQRNVWLYFAAISLIGFTVDGGIYSVVFNLFLLRLGYGPEFVGQVNSAGLLAFALCSLPAGALGGRIGNRRAMIVGLCVMMVSSLLLTYSESIGTTWREPWIFATYCLFHSSIAIFFVNTAPFLMASTTEAQQNHAFSIQSAMISAAAFVGSMAGGFLPGVFAHTMGVSLEVAMPYRYPLLIAGLTLNLGIIILFLARDEPTMQSAQTLQPRPRRTYPSFFRVPRFGRINLQNIDRNFIKLVLVVSSIRFFQIAGMAVLMTFFNVYMDDGLGAPISQVGLLTGLGRLLAVPIVLTMPVLSARWGNRDLSVGASMSAVLFLLPLAFIPTWWAAGIGYMGVMAGSSIRYTSFLIYVMSMIKPEQRSFMSGINEMTAGLSFAGMALVGGYIIVNQGYQTLFLLGAALTFVGTLIFWGYFRTIPAGIALASGAKVAGD
jgi:MFS family permease